MMKELGTMLELKGVSKIIGDKPILKGLSLRIGPGESIAVIGPNGAGKSTFFKCAVGLMQPTSGEIYLDGKKLKKNSVAARNKMGFLGHESFLYSNLSAIENLRFYADLYKVKMAEDKAHQLLREVGLHYFKDVPIRSFSRGMLQRLAIARVLLAEPKLLLLDEPHTGLDQEAVGLLNSIILAKQAEGTAIILISHDFEQVMKVCERVVVIAKGKITATTETAQFTGVEQLKDWYEEAVQRP